MRYLVVLDTDSPVGAMYAQGSNDGFTQHGNHPVLDCTEIDLDEPNYMYVKRDMSRHGGSYQKAYLPHSSVVVIHPYEDVEKMPVGFLRPEP